MSCKNLLRISNLSFSFTEDEPLIRRLSLSLTSGQRIALTGPNGGGKSTLLRIMAKQLGGFEGALNIDCKASLVSQDAANEHRGLSGGESRLRSILTALECSPDLLLLDEPTNDLDLNSKKVFFEQLLSFSGTSVIVSHDPAVLDFVDEIWELKNGAIQKHPPGFEEYINRIEEEEDSLREQIKSLESEKRKREDLARLAIERQEKRAARGKASGIKSNLPKVIRGAKKRQAENTLAKVKDVHEKIVSQSDLKLKESQQRLRELSMFKWDSAVTKPPSGKRMFQIDGLTMKGFQKPLNYSLCGASRIHLSGRNGSGKSTLLHALAGDASARSRTSGNLYLADSYHLFDQKLAGFDSSEKLWEWFWQKSSLQILEARQILGRLGFEQDEQDRPVNGLSGGEKIRLELALALYKSKPPMILLLDEPTNHLDIESRKVLIEFLRDFEGAMVVVSHDSRFLNAIQFDAKIDLDEFF